MGTLAGKFEDFARDRRQLFFCCNLVTAVLMVGKGLIFHFTGVDSNIFSLKTKIGLDLLPYVWKQYSNLRKNFPLL